MTYRLIQQDSINTYRWRAEPGDGADYAGLGNSELDAVVDLIARVACDALIGDSLSLFHWAQWEPWGKREMVRLAAERAEYWKRACQEALQNPSSGRKLHARDIISVRSRAARWGATAAALRTMNQETLTEAETG